MRKYLLLAACALGIFSALPAHAETIIKNAYAFATAPGQANGAAFLSIENKHDLTEYLASASTEVAARTELHTHAEEGGVMQMRPVEHILIPAGETHALQPMGDHIMLMGLNKQLNAGESFPLTMVFEMGETMTVDVQIVPPGEVPASHLDAAH